MIKATKIQKYTALINVLRNEDPTYEDKDGNIIALERDFLEDFCQKEIDNILSKAAKARERNADKVDALAEVVYDALTSDLECAADITARVKDRVDDGVKVTVGMVQYRLNQLFKDGRAEKGDIVIPATEITKRRTVVGYKMCAVATPTDDYTNVDSAEDA